MKQQIGTVKQRRLPRWSRLLVFVTLLSILLGAISSLQAHAASVDHKRLAYYGANLEMMEDATGISTTTGMPIKGGAWPQYAGNYCFTAVVQAVTNYMDLKKGLPMRYPSPGDEGPISGNPNDAQRGQILYDMDHAMIAPGGPLPLRGSGANRRPFTLANTAYDFGGDPRSQAFGIDYEAPQGTHYHEHIYDTSPQDATHEMAKALARYSEPVVALINHAEHSVIVAGVWATENPLTDTDSDVQIRALAVFNPWDMRWGAYISKTNYVKVSYKDWTAGSNLPVPWGGVTTWLKEPYNSNGVLDPDPSIGIYQAGPGTKHPKAHHWIGNFVIIQPDSHHQSANFSFDEDDRLMLKP